MGHDILQGDLTVKSQSGPRSAKSMEAVCYWVQVQGTEDLSKSISNMSINDRVVRILIRSKKRERGWQGSRIHEVFEG